ncbi:hypothetical protein D3C73_1508560 [compost metagenome]
MVGIPKGNTTDHEPVLVDAEMSTHKPGVAGQRGLGNDPQAQCLGGQQQVGYVAAAIDCTISA